jgi:hypothetical protein
MRRVIAHGLPLDMATTLTRGLPGWEETLLASVPLADLGAPTLVLRKGETAYLGQFRQRGDRKVAHVTFLAPDPQAQDVYEWARVLEAIAFEAGKRGAHLINAEVEENHPVFEAFRLAGFAVYARQVILRREPGQISAHAPAMLRPVSDRDVIAISTLRVNTVPRLLQQAELLPDLECGGLIYEHRGQVAGYLTVFDGKVGVVIKPYFHPEVDDQAAAIIMSALAHIPHADRVPVYLYARAYQDWLRGALDEVEFKPWTHQALMVKYTLVRAERAEAVALPGLEANRLRPPVADGPMPLRKFMNRSDRAQPWRRNGK